jgi:hypothetical protein
MFFQVILLNYFKSFVFIFCAVETEHSIILSRGFLTIDGVCIGNCIC